MQGEFSVLFPDVTVGDGTRIGNFVMIRSNMLIGNGCIIGSYVDSEDEVFCGPRVITMNDKGIVHRRPGLAFVREVLASSAPRGMAGAASSCRA